jgi:hypothetical protein
MFNTDTLEGFRGHPGANPLHDLRHRGAIESLSQELGMPFETVAARYEALLRELLTHARVVDFLPVIVAKHLRKILKSVG